MTTTGAICFGLSTGNYVVSTDSVPSQIVLDHGAKPFIKPFNNPTIAAVINLHEQSNALSTVDETLWASGDLSRVLAHHDDFHFRFWVIPSELRLNNPTIGTNIPFIIWSSFTEIATLQSISLSGTSALVFDKTPLVSTIRDSEYQTVNMQILPGEPNIDAMVDFNYDLGDAIFHVIAIISSTFNLIPDVPVEETWDFMTDIIKSYDGTEQRICLRSDPRRSLNFTVDIIDLKDRREQYELLFKNFAVQAIVPNYHHATRLTQVAPVGASRLYFDASQTQMRQGESIAIINITTKKAYVFQITNVYADGVDIGSTLADELSLGNYVYPAHAMILKNNSGLTMYSVTGKLDIQADSYGVHSLPRPGATPTINTLDGYNIMEIRPLTGAEEFFQTDATILDYDVGPKTIQRTAAPHPIISGQRQWQISRYSDSDKEDYMRQFIDDVKGAQKAWLLPTWLPDLTLAPIAAPAPLTGIVQINEADFGSLFLPHETWKRIMIQYQNLPPTYHTISGATTRPDGYVDLSFSPPLADNPEVANITMISFLLKVRGDDSIKRQHYHRETIYSWAITTTDAG